VPKTAADGEPTRVHDILHCEERLEILASAALVINHPEYVVLTEKKFGSHNAGTV
jgi:hypothetical protein